MPLQDWDSCLFKGCREDMLEAFKLLVDSVCMTYGCNQNEVLNIRNENDEKTSKGATLLMVSCQYCNDIELPVWIGLRKVDFQAKDDDGKDIMDYINMNEKCGSRLEKLFGADLLWAHETLGGHSEDGRTSYLKM